MLSWRSGGWGWHVWGKYNYVWLRNTGSLRQRKEAGTGLWLPGDTIPVYFTFYFEMNGFSHE
jgi:hypothetical protein